ncbi:hypothetical protein COBT_000288 [Conglomerata obtusa]
MNFKLLFVLLSVISIFVTCAFGLIRQVENSQFKSIEECRDFDFDKILVDVPFSMRNLQKESIGNSWITDFNAQFESNGDDPEVYKPARHSFLSYTVANTGTSQYTKNIKGRGYGLNDTNQSSMNELFLNQTGTKEKEKPQKIFNGKRNIGIDPNSYKEKMEKNKNISYTEKLVQENKKLTNIQYIQKILDAIGIIFGYSDKFGIVNNDNLITQNKLSNKVKLDLDLLDKDCDITFLQYIHLKHRLFLKKNGEWFRYAVNAVKDIDDQYESYKDHQTKDVTFNLKLVRAFRRLPYTKNIVICMGNNLYIFGEKLINLEKNGNVRVYFLNNNLQQLFQHVYATIEKTCNNLLANPISNMEGHCKFIAFSQVLVYGFPGLIDEDILKEYICEMLNGGKVVTFNDLADITAKLEYDSIFRQR